MNFIENIKKDINGGDSFFSVIDRKIRHTLYTHQYELWSIRKYYKKGKVLNVGAGRDCGKLGDNVISLDFRQGEDSYTKSLGWNGIKPDIVCDMHDIVKDDNTFDCIIAMHVLEHSCKPIQLLDELLRVTKSGGYVAIILPCGAGMSYYNYTKDETHEYMWTRYDFIEWLNSIGVLSPKILKGRNLINTATISQYCSMKPWINKWSFDCVLRKN